MGYTGHIDGTKSQMSLYLTSSVNTTATVSIPQLGISTTYTITANNVTVAPISSLAYVGSSEVIEDKGIQVVSEHPVVVYSHIYSQNRSAATLVLPTNTLGREYFATSYTPDANNQYAEFMVVATEDNTLVEITPRAATRSGKAAFVPFQVSLNKGQVYQVQSSSDLTGSKIVSVSNGGQSCKKIAVFSGNTFVGIGCSNAGSRDNLYQQLYPLSTWGTNFVTAPFKTRLGGDVFRVLGGFPNTTVSINGVSQGLNTGDFLEFTSATANYITSDKPVTVLQYARTQNCDNITGDPEMIILNPVEQTLEDITLYSSPYYQITGHYINVVMKTEFISTFRLDGAAVTFVPVASNPEYSYAQVTVGAGNHRLTAKSGFNAMAYGFGNVESYGYSAGANIKNLNQNITFDAQTYCDGATVSFTGFASYEPQSWLWEFGDGSTSAEQNPKYSYAAPGTYTVKLTTIKNNGNDCDSKDETTAELIVYPNPAADFTFVSECLNGAVLFKDASAVAGNNSKITEWFWEFGDGSTSAEQNPRHVYANPGTYDVKIIIKTSAGCTNQVTKKAEMLPKPVLSFEAAAVCNTFTSRFTDKSTSVVPITEWEWNFGDGTIMKGSGNTQYTYADAGTYNVTLTLTFEEGCQSSVTQAVVVYPKPRISMELPGVCISDEAQFVNKTTITSGTLSYLWDFGDGFTSTLEHPKHKYKAEGIYKVKLIATSDKGCTDTVEMDYLVSGANPQAKFSTSGSCQRDGVQFKDESSIAFGKIIKWEWNFGDGTTSDEQHPLHIYKEPGTYQVSLKAYSGIICHGSFSKTVTILVSPTASFETDNVCFGEKASFMSTSSVKTGSIVSHKWDFGDGNSASIVNPTHTYAAAGTYDVILTVTTDKGCEHSYKKQIKVYAKPQAAFSPIVGCISDAVVFRDESTIVNGSIIAWSWSFGNGTTSDLQHPSHMFAMVGNYLVKLQVTTADGCKSEVEKTLTIKALPVANAGPDQKPVCGTTSTGLQANVPVNGSGLWTIISGTGAQFSDPNNPKSAFAGKMEETYKLRWTVSNSPCVAVSDDVEIKFSAYPEVNAGQDLEIIEGESITLKGNGTGTLEWSPAVSLDNASIARPTASPEKNTVYILKATSADGCVRTDEMTVRVLQRLQIPNGISPNGDNINDVWLIKGVEDYPDITIDIYNRWGDKVYNSRGYGNPWDGTRNGAPLPDGAYYYVIDTNKGRKPFTGSITVLRK
ncbi:hypothetical protein GCM10027293_22870 [Pontibacter aydingkolensis]